MTKLKIFIIFICIILLVTACTKKENTKTDSVSSSKSEETSTAYEAETSEPSLEAPTVSFDAASSSEKATTEVISDESLDVTFTEEAKSSEAISSEILSTSTESVTPSNDSIQAGQLTAGEWNDIENWDFWLNLMNTWEYSNYLTNWEFNLAHRIKINLTTDGQELEGASVLLKDIQDNVIWESVTDQSGTAYLFNITNEKDATIEIAYLNQVLKSFKYNNLESEMRLDIRNIKNSPSNDVDILFMVDTTGSMSDELNYLKEELKSVITSIREHNNQLKLHLSANYYRDAGDDYIVKPFPFTDDIDEVMDQISNQYANGGGDIPEAVDEALYNAIYEHEWSDTAKAKLVFLVLDAPPHYTSQAVDSINETILTASRMGIKIIPIASSGIDKETEMILRSMAILTNGTYTFLTDDSGIGESHLEPTIGQYDVEFLNDLLVRLIEKYTN